MDCWLSESFSSLLLNELAEKPAISGRARESAAGESAALRVRRGMAGADHLAYLSCLILDKRDGRANT